MTIETRFNVGDTVWYLNENALAPQQTTITALGIQVSNTIDIVYTLNTVPARGRTEKQIYANLEELAIAMQENAISAPTRSK
jgi:FtsP/CotA-like multicopper oxidase with cupredoxin domain